MTEKLTCHGVDVMHEFDDSGKCVRCPVDVYHEEHLAEIKHKLDSMSLDKYTYQSDPAEIDKERNEVYKGYASQDSDIFEWCEHHHDFPVLTAEGEKLIGAELTKAFASGHVKWHISEDEKGWFTITVEPLLKAKSNPPGVEVMKQEICENPKLKTPHILKNGVYRGSAIFSKSDGNYYQFDQVDEKHKTTNQDDSVVIFAETQKDLDKKIAFLEQRGVIPKSWQSNYKGYDIKVHEEQTPDRNGETYTISITKDGETVMRGSADYRRAGKQNMWKEYIHTDKYKKFGVRWRGINAGISRALNGNMDTYHQCQFINVESSLKRFVDLLSSGQIAMKPQVDWNPESNPPSCPECKDIILEGVKSNPPALECPACEKVFIENPATDSYITLTKNDLKKLAKKGKIIVGAYAHHGGTLKYSVEVRK